MNSKKVIKLAQQVNLLKGLPRTGWLNKNIKNPESVAEHTWRVAILAMILGPELKVNQEKLVKMALIHDLGEASIGDLVWERGNKVVGSQQEKHKDELEAVKEMFGNTYPEYLELWKEFEKQETPEAKALKLFDKLEMVMQALDYEKNGYAKNDLQEFWDNSEKYLKNSELEELFAQLKKLRKSSDK